MYQLFCDSNCELWYTKVQELGLNVIRMPYILDGEEYFYDIIGFISSIVNSATGKGLHPRPCTVKLFLRRRQDI